MIPLYSSVGGNGNNAVYQIVGFAGVRVAAADLQGNPKRVWAQPTAFYTTGAVASGNSSATVGVFAPPRLVLP